MTKPAKFLKLFILLFFPLAIIFIVSTAYVILFDVSYLEGGWIWDLSQEKTVATYFESVLFLLCSSSFYFLSQNFFKTKINHSKTYAWFFGLFSLLFLFLTIDESVEVHENLGIFIENKFGILEKTNIAKVGYSWLIIYVPGFIIGTLFLFFFIKFTKKLWLILKKETSKKILFLLSIAIISVLLTFSLEFLDAYYRILNTNSTLLPWIEESSEIIFIFSIIGVCYLLLKEKITT